MEVRRTVLVLSLLSLVFGGSIALAEPRSNLEFNQSQIIAQSNNNRPSRRGTEGLIEQLNLSETQQKQLDTIRQKYQKQIEPLRQQMKTKMDQFQQLMSGNPSTDTIRAKHQEIVNLRQQLENLRFESMLETRNILTPQQRTQLAQLMEQQHKNRRSRSQPPAPPEP